MNVIGFLVRKYVLAAAVNLTILRGLASVTATEALLIALAATVISYPLVEVRTYPTWGNAVATVMDLLIIWAVIWGSGRLWTAVTIGVRDSAFAAGAIATGEWFLHEQYGRMRVQSKLPE